MKKTLIALTLCLAATSAHADGGGDALVCFNASTARRDLRAIARNGGLIPDNVISHIRSVESYDLVEARTPRGASGRMIPAIAAMDARETPLSYAHRVIARLEPLASGLYNDLNDTLSSLDESQVVLQPNGVVPVEDTDPTDSIDREHCVLSTISHHVYMGPRPFIHLDRRLYNHPSFSSLSKALLVLHAVVYLNAQNNYGHTDGRLSRLFVGTLVAENREITGRALLDIANGARMMPPGHTMVLTHHEQEFLTSCSQAWLLLGRMAHSGGTNDAIADRFHGALARQSWASEDSRIISLVQTYGTRLEAAERSSDAWGITAHSFYLAYTRPHSGDAETNGAIGTEGLNYSLRDFAADLLPRARAMTDINRPYPIAPYAPEPSISR